MSRIARSNHAQSPADIVAGREFNCTNMSARKVPSPGYSPMPGDLAGDDLAAFMSDRRNGLIDYVVMSFSTPIAWRRKDKTWHVVEQKFSTTTSKHQGRLYLIPSGRGNTGREEFRTT